jgi:hypothetical protein
MPPPDLRFDVVNRIPGQGSCSGRLTTGGKKSQTTASNDASCSSRTIASLYSCERYLATAYGALSTT